MPDGVDVTSPPFPFATTVSVEVDGPQGLPQVNVPPHPSEMVPHVFPCAAQVVGVHTGVAVTLRLVVAVVLKLAEMLADTVPDCSAVVVAVKVATLLPDGIRMLGGTETKLLSLDSATVAPPNGAGGSSVIVPVDEPPPTTVAGFIVTEVTDETAVPHWPATPPPPQVSPKLQPQLIVPPHPSGVGPQDGPPEQAMGTHPWVTVRGCVSGACPGAPDEAVMLTTVFWATEFAAWIDSGSCATVQLPSTNG